ncbi:MAG: hypothetical protein IJ291_00445, partial [Lachnospiraceae bacterium]|nr:hypothetical protein [Lachnospiraceae bacterium]
MEQDVKRNKKRDIIKNVAIIFLSVMLLLTFFSNTIMNYSLPEVSTRYVMGENISNRIRGTGVVESVDPYNVIVNETRTVSSVAVYVDEYVEKDAVIYTLSGKESEELDQAKAEKDAAQIEYEKMILNGGISSARLKEIQAGKVQTLEQSQAALDAFQSKIDSNQTTVDNLSKQIAILEQTGVDASDESKALASAQKKLNNARVDLSKKQAAYDALADRADTDEEKIAAKAALDAAQTLVWELEAKVANAQLALEQKLNSTEIADQIKNLNVQKINADTALTEAKEGKQNLLDKILLEMDVYDTYKKLQEKKDLVKELEEEALGGEVVAPVAGKIVSLSYTAGEDTVPGEVAAVIQVEGKGYMLSFSAGVRQAATVNIGDEVEVQDGWYYGDVTARLSAIKTDKENP